MLYLKILLFKYLQTTRMQRTKHQFLPNVLLVGTGHVNSLRRGFLKVKKHLNVPMDPYTKRCSHSLFQICT